MKVSADRAGQLDGKHYTHCCGLVVRCPIGPARFVEVEGGVGDETRR